MAYSLITGASGGIGWALSKELASRKHDILLLARSGEQLRKNADQLQKDYGVRADYFEIDLSAPDAALKVLDWLQQKQYAIDILINNAGYAVWGKFQDLSRDELNRMMQLNMITMADMCKVLLPLLQQQKPAYLLNVSSTSGYQAVPTLSSYAASKAFVLLFTRGLHREMKGSNVSVSCLCPGTTTSGFMDRANMEPLKKTAEKFTMDATLVAKKAIDGLLAGKAEIIPGFMNWFSAKMAEIVPKAIPEKIAENIYKV